MKTFLTVHYIKRFTISEFTIARVYCKLICGSLIGTRVALIWDKIIVLFGIQSLCLKSKCLRYIWPTNMSQIAYKLKNGQNAYSHQPMVKMPKNRGYTAVMWPLQTTPTFYIQGFSRARNSIKKVPGAYHLRFPK